VLRYPVQCCFKTLTSPRGAKAKHKRWEQEGGKWHREEGMCALCPRTLCPSTLRPRPQRPRALYPRRRRPRLLVSEASLREKTKERGAPCMAPKKMHLSS
ncbi:unnamed protein product, partial [Discosporangium mesarthrocarpum]